MNDVDLKIDAASIKAAEAAAVHKVSRAAKRAIFAGTEGVKLDFRDATEGAGLGKRLALTWQGRVYPGNSRRSRRQATLEQVLAKGGDTVEPAGIVYTNAPEIISSFATGTIIVPKKGRFLAIPNADAVPRIGNGRYLTPNEVEARFGRPLTFVENRNGRGARLVLDEATQRPNGSFGRARAGQRRGVVGVVMFFLIRRAVIASRGIDFDAIAGVWSGRLPQLFADALTTEQR